MWVLGWKSPAEAQACQRLFAPPQTFSGGEELLLSLPFGGIG
jgi:hypothetical protein